MEDNENNSRNVPGANQSANMYSYNNDQQQSQIKETDAIRRSLGEMNPNAIQNEEYINNVNQNNEVVNPNAVVIEIDQSPPLYWMFFLVFGIIQIVFIILLANYYYWDKLNYPGGKDGEKNYEAKEMIEKYYKSFQDINVMIFLGFGFLRAILKHHSWFAISITLLAGILSIEFGLFAMICWSSILRQSWYNGLFNFRYLLDSNYCAAATIIAMGAIFGKLYFAQYIVMILSSTVFSTLNYTLIRQKIHCIDTGGALTVHLFGAIFGAFFTFICFYPKEERERIKKSPHLAKNYYSVLFSFIGTVILVSYWPSFNTGLIEGNPKYRGIINTYFSIGGSIIGTFMVTSVLHQRKFKVEDIINSSFAGGIAISGCCSIIRSFYLSIVFGIIAGALSSSLFYSLNDKLTKIGYHDTSGILYYHGIPGLLGGILSTIFVGCLANWDYNKSELDNNRHELYMSLIDEFLPKEFAYNITKLYKRDDNISIGTRAWIQFGCIFLTIVIAGVTGLFSGFLIKFCNCEIAKRYFNDSEFFDVSDNEPFPWEDEEIKIKLKYHSDNKK